MSVVKFNRNFSALFNWDSDENPTTEQEYQGAVKNWTETEMNIVDTILWQPEMDYTEANIVKTPSLPLHYVLVCTTGGTSGTEEPSYDNVQIGDSVTDGTITWTVAKLTVSSDVPTVTDRAMVDASNIGVNAEEDNSEAWGSAIGGGAVAEDDGKLVTGGTVYAVTNGLASDIATNTANISQNATDIDIADKRISNIEKLLQGNLYDYQSDTDSAYTKTVPAGAMPWASLDSIGGRTLVWNQIFPYDFSTTSGMDIYNCTASASGNVLTMTVDGTQTIAYVGTRTTYTPKFEKSHTFYVSADVYNAVEGANVSFRLYGVDTDVDAVNSPVMASTGFVHQQRICKGATAGQEGRMRVMANSISVAGTVQVKNAFICDLTLMFGAGNEPTTVAEFQQTFPAQYYAYNEGMLLSAGVAEVVSESANIIPITSPQTITAVGVTVTMNTNGTVTFSGTCSASGGRNVPPVSFSLKAGTYYFQSTFGASYLQKGLTILATPYNSFTLTETTTVNIGFNFTSGTTYNSSYSVQLVRGGSAKDYAPYKAPITYPIPAEIQSLEGYGWSAGSVYNYIDYERKVFVQRVGSVDLGTLTWTTSETSSPGIYKHISGVLVSAKAPANAQSKANAICDKYVTLSYSEGYSANVEKSITIIFASSSQAKKIYIIDSAYATDTAFNAFINGVYLYYELSTPIETDISAYLTDDNLIQVEAGGTLTFPNSNGDDYRIPVPSAETYMVDLQSALGE